jgi:hypothetical protein
VGGGYVVMWSISDRSTELRRPGKLLQRHLSRAWTMEKNKNQQGPRQEWEIDVTGIGKPKKKNPFFSITF